MKVENFFIPMLIVVLFGSIFALFLSAGNDYYQPTDYDTHRTSADSYTYTFGTAIDCTGYESATVRVKVYTTTSGDLDISSVQVGYYYA